MFIALVLFAALGDLVGRLLKSAFAKLPVPGRMGCPADASGPEAMAI
jgi:hypothetical protein